MRTFDLSVCRLLFAWIDRTATGRWLACFRSCQQVGSRYNSARTPRWIAAASTAALSGLVGGVGWASDDVEVTWEVAPDGTTSQRCVQSGAGNAFMRWCVSEHGNLSLESPGSNQLIEPFREGYAVCSQNPGGQLTHGYDAGHIEGPFPGWSPAAVTFPSAASAQVVRTTPDGKLQLSMKFTRDSKTLDVLIATTVTNISPQRLVDVRYTRYSSNDTMASYHDRTASSAWWRRDDFGPLEPPPVGLALTMPTHLAGVFARTYHQSPLVWFDAPYWCVPAPNQTFAAPGVGGGALYGVYFLGDLNPGQKKTVTHVYRRL